MPTIGQTISRHTISEKLGQGGMGEVYRTRDLTLGRDVATKVLLDEFARDHVRSQGSSAKQSCSPLLIIRALGAGFRRIG